MQQQHKTNSSRSRFVLQLFPDIEYPLYVDVAARKVMGLLISNQPHQTTYKVYEISHKQAGFPRLTVVLLLTRYKIYSLSDAVCLSLLARIFSFHLRWFIVRRRSSKHHRAA